MDEQSVTVSVEYSELKLCIKKKEVMWPGFDRGGSVKADAASHSQQETLADIEHISTIAGSLGSIGSISQCPEGDPVYETDHTDLNSEYDEAELRKELMKDKWRQLFDAFDPEGFGEIPVNDFIEALKSPEFLANVPPNKRDILYDRTLKAKSSKAESISFQDFVNVIMVGNEATTTAHPTQIRIIKEGRGASDQPRPSMRVVETGRPIPTVEESAVEEENVPQPMPERNEAQPNLLTDSRSRKRKFPSEPVVLTGLPRRSKRIKKPRIEKEYEYF